MNKPSCPCEIPLESLLELYVVEQQLHELLDVHLPPGVHASLRLASQRIDKALSLLVESSL